MRSLVLMQRSHTSRSQANWSWGYFHEGRNVGVIVEGAPFAERLDRLFESLLTSGYATALDPDARYPLPRIGE